MGGAVLWGVGPAAAETFRDCADCPVMVKIKPGAFMMGSTEVETAREDLDAMLAREGRTELAQACFDFLPTRAKLDLSGWEAEDIFAHS